MADARSFGASAISRSALLGTQAQADTDHVSVSGLPACFAEQHLQLWETQAEPSALSLEALLRVCEVLQTSQSQHAAASAVPANVCRNRPKQQRAAYRALRMPRNTYQCATV